jgi:hypothetical protein
MMHEWFEIPTTRTDIDLLRYQNLGPEKDSLYLEIAPFGLIRNG